MKAIYREPVFSLLDSSPLWRIVATTFTLDILPPIKCRYFLILHFLVWYFSGEMSGGEISETQIYLLLKKMQSSNNKHAYHMIVLNVHIIDNI